ncbi:hypothetical protein QJS10_CPA03g01022 [Acorus calamus]|uniref:PLAC8 family protein n=1 Tax=Acorus calamus TaxID=4465 RepID=A0AAV9F3V5_ACOCL|nr:hypothetical protein QJS10_CPA03g01022 [Acorus calamus]
MVATGNGESLIEIQEAHGTSIAPNGNEAKDQTALYASTSRKLLLGERGHRNKFLDVIVTLPNKAGQLKLGSRSKLASPSAKFRRIVEEREEASRSVPSSGERGSPKNFSIPFIKKINWVSLKEICKLWIRNPINMALLVWITCVAVSGALLFLVMTGMLNNVLPKKSDRDAWFEVNNQILNALFTLMCLYQHPKRFHHLVLLLRWRPDDILKLRKIYCKNGTYKPNEWAHMMVVVVLLHLNCFAQYALCGLNLGYNRSRRPAIGVGLCLSVSFLAAALASVYNILSPLGREYDSETDEEAQAQAQALTIEEGKPNQLRSKTFEKKYSFAIRDTQRVEETRPTWIGGLFDLWDDVSLAYLSLFCSFCVFGWNMDRIGLGNMYVHITTFILFCVAPFWIFNLAAININNETIREALGVTGIVLCLFGLLYGGFWRIQLRKRFNLPENPFCCGYPAVTDCMQWLFCCPCSLAQEVRTVDYYDIVEDKFYRKTEGDGGSPVLLSPLRREEGMNLFRSSPSSPYNGSSSPPAFRAVSSPSPSRFSRGIGSPDVHLPALDEESSMRDESNVMTPPLQLSIQRDDDHLTPPV